MIIFETFWYTFIIRQKTITWPNSTPLKQYLWNNKAIDWVGIRQIKSYHCNAYQAKYALIFIQLVTATESRIHAS